MSGSDRNTIMPPAGRVIMVRPATFCSNPETRESNAFQNSGGSASTDVLTAAQKEFDGFQAVLEKQGIRILKFTEAASSAGPTPDALFPNNWFMHFPDGRVFLMPMQAPNRRREYRADIVAALAPREVIDLRGLAGEGHFLEGTGSLIPDHTAKVAYAARSPRTSDRALDIFYEKSGYEIIRFDARDASGRAIYHTNVMMALGTATAVVNLDSIPEGNEKNRLIGRLTESGRTVVPVTYEQTLSFAGNMLLLQNRQKQNFWVCSEKAHRSLTPEQRDILRRDGEFLVSDLNTIETYGGGGARCLLAEAF